MKKYLLLLAVVLVFPAVFYGNGTRDDGYEDFVENSIISRTEEVSLLESGIGLTVTVGSYADLVKDSRGRIVSNSVQDILADKKYEAFNKGLSRFDKIKIYPSNEQDAVEAVVLFNLDIYSYLTEQKDPVTDIERRIDYSEKTFLSYPLVLRFSRRELQAVISEQLGHSARGDLYYFEPESPGSDSGKWYSVVHLKDLGEIDYTIDGDGVITVTIYKWPRDDRVHVGA